MHCLVFSESLWMLICKYWKMARDARWSVDTTLYEFISDALDAEASGDEA